MSTETILVLSEADVVDAFQECASECAPDCDCNCVDGDCCENY